LIAKVQQKKRYQKRYFPVDIDESSQPRLNFAVQRLQKFLRAAIGRPAEKTQIKFRHRY
jgi:hypothetical protein